MTRFLYFLVLLIFLSCSHAENPKERFDKWAKKGQVIPSVACKDNQGLTYSLYLPTTYNLKQQFPLLYVFDPKGEGSYAVSMFQGVAERLGYIIVGSNNSKNGLKPDEIQYILDALFKDIRELLSIDPQRIYAAGFSGGARVACSAALSYSFISGVIACSGGFQPSASSRSFNVIGLAGNADMNYLEMKSLEMSLAQWPAKHIFIAYEGKHAWPPKPVLERALVSLQIFSMDNNAQYLDTSIIQSYIDTCLNLSNLYLTDHQPEDIMMAQKTINNTLAVVGNMADTARLISVRNSLDKDKINKALADELAMERYEMSKQQELLSAFTKQSKKWWADEMHYLENTKVQGKTANARLVSSRLLAFVSLVSYSYVNSAINQSNWDAASMFLDIYGIADPENPDYNYFRACFWANARETNKAIEFLQKAKQYGYPHMNILASDPLLRSMAGNKDFIALTGKK